MQDATYIRRVALLLSQLLAYAYRSPQTLIAFRCAFASYAAGRLGALQNLQEDQPAADVLLVAAVRR
jgi:hypothetical protein